MLRNNEMNIGFLNTIMSYCKPKEKENNIERPFFPQFTRLWLLAYAQHSSVNGLRYLADGRRYWSETVWWALFMLLAAAGSVYMIADSYDKWHQAPVIVAFNERATAVTAVPFPAVTVCLQRVALVARQPDDDEDENFRDAEQVNGTAVQMESKRTAPRVADCFGRLCMYGKVAVRCDRVFRPTVHTEGEGSVCFSFNVQPPAEMYRDT